MNLFLSRYSECFHSLGNFLCVRNFGYDRNTIIFLKKMDACKKRENRSVSFNVYLAFPWNRKIKCNVSRKKDGYSRKFIQMYPCMIFAMYTYVIRSLSFENQNTSSHQLIDAWLGFFFFFFELLESFDWVSLITINNISFVPSIIRFYNF